MPNGNPSPMQQGQYQAAQNQLGAGYQQYLGRPMNDHDFASQTSGGRDYQQKNVNYALDNIRNSEEARNYQARQNAPQQVNTPDPTPDGGSTDVQEVAQGAAAPGVPQTYANNGGQSMQSRVAAAGNSAPSIQSKFTAQQIRDFQGRDLNIPAYVKSQFSQFTDPRDTQIQGQVDSNLLNLLQNPHSLSQTWQDQMFEQQKDDALSFAKQSALGSDQQLVNRGVGLGGGQQVAAQRDIDSNLFSQLLAGRRDIATQAALQNRADDLNALQAGEAGLSGDTSRMSQIFQNLLAGQSAQAGENQFDAKYGFDTTTALADNERQNYSGYLGGRGLQGQENAREEQFRQSAFGLSQQARQAAEQMALNSYMAGNNMDLGWANYGLDADGQFLNYLNGQG